MIDYIILALREAIIILLRGSVLQAQAMIDWYF